MSIYQVWQLHEHDTLAEATMRIKILGFQHAHKEECFCGRVSNVTVDQIYKFSGA